MVRIGEPERLRIRWRNVWAREKNAVPPDVALERRTKRVIPGFRPVRSLLDAVGPFAALCYRPRLPVRHWGRDMSAPKPYVTNPTPIHSSRPPLSLQFNVRFRWLIYSRQKSFYLSYGKHCSRGIQSVRTRPAKGNIHKCIKRSFIPEFRVTTRVTIMDTLHLQLKYIARTDT